MWSPAVELPSQVVHGRLWSRVSLVLFYAGLVVTYWVPAFNQVGVGVLIVGLLVGLLGAPLEYAMGAVAFAFLGAACLTLWAAFQTLRWVFLAGGAVILSLRYFLRGRGAAARLPNRFGHLTSLFLALGAITVITSVSPVLAVMKLSAFACLFYLASKAGDRLVEMYGPSSARRLAPGFLVYVSGVVVISILRYVAAPGGRALFRGYLGNPNAWGALMCVALPWMACPLFRRSPAPPGWRTALTVALAVTGYTLLLSTSRAGILGAVGAIVFFCVAHADRRVAVVALLAGVFLIFRASTRPDFFESLLDRYYYKYQYVPGAPGRGSMQPFESRLELWRVARRNFLEKPWLGMGFGVTSKAESEWSFDVRSGMSIETGSSLWSTLSQVGVVGAAPLFLATITLLVRAGRFAWRVRDPWLTAIYGSTLALGINAAFEGWLIAPGNFLTTYFWMQCFFLNAMMRCYCPAPAPRARVAWAPHLGDCGEKQLVGLR